jgi:hypothetical protein
MRNALLTLLILLWLPATAAAAVDRPGTAEIRQDERRVTWVIGLPADELASLAVGDTKEAIAGYMGNTVRIALDDSSCAGGMDHATPERFRGAAFTRVELRYTCPEQYGTFTVTSEMLLPLSVDYELGGASGTLRLDADNTVRSVKSPEFPRWLRDGAQALLLGWEHVLFLTVLLLGARSTRELGAFAASVAAAFALALLLGAYDVVNVPERGIEALTVASVVAVAALPVLGISGRPQLMIVFALALVHGLAFALLVPTTAALPGFVAGLLLAQALVVTLAGGLLRAWPARDRTPGAPERGRARSAAR